MSDKTLTLTAHGEVEQLSETDGDGVSIRLGDPKSVTATVEIGAHRLLSDDYVDVYNHGARVKTSGVAESVAEEIGSDTAALNADEWEVSIKGSLDEWQDVVLAAADSRRMTTTATIETAIEILLSLNEDAQTDRPLYVALNIDEQKNEAARREEILEKISDDDAPASAEPGSESTAAD